MRTVIGWIGALLGSALLGAVVYETVLADSLPEPDSTAILAVTPSPQATPAPRPTLYQTEVRKVIKPTPTVTVVDQVVVPVAPAAQPAPARAAATPRPTQTKRRATSPAPSERRETREDDHKSEDREDHSPEVEQD